MIDQLEAIGKQSRNKENGEIDLALLTDGLRAEREQGITIDVAYKYFSLPRGNLFLLMLQGTFNTHATWLLALRMPIWLLSDRCS